VRLQALQLFLQDTNYDLQVIGNHWKSALNLCLHLVQFANNVEKDDDSKTNNYSNMAARKLPLLLIEDCLDGLSVQDCQEFWSSFVEPALDEVLLGDLLWKSSTVCHLPFLRVCNQFLKLLATASTSDDQEWKGRILWALSKGFSIADRSAMKVWGSFHTSNITNYESKEDFDTTSDKSSSASINYSLYQAFWSLQADFSNPNRIQVGDFIKKMKLVLKGLESATSQHTSSSSSTASTPTPSSIRYLTSSTLLPSQLANADFRSCVVTQFLIVASHLSSESPPLANALSGLLSRAHKLLKTDHPELYTILWDSILSDREAQWRQWKKQKCPASAFAPKRKVDKTNVEKKQRARLLDGPLGNNESGSSSMKQGYELLGKDDLLKFSQDLVKTVPTLEQHLEPYVEALDPESGIENEYHPKNDSLYSWRAMRLYAKHQLPLLKHCRKPADLERMTRQWYVSQGKVIAGEMPPEDEEEDYSDDDESDKDSTKDFEKEDEDEGSQDPIENDAEMDDAEQENDGEEDEEEDKETQEDEKDKESLPDANDDDKEEERDEAANDAEMEEKEDGIDDDEAGEQPTPKNECDAVEVNEDEVGNAGNKQASEKDDDDDGAGAGAGAEKGDGMELEKEEDEGQVKERQDTASIPAPEEESEDDEGEVESAGKRVLKEPTLAKPDSRSGSREPEKPSSLPPREKRPREDNRGRGPGPRHQRVRPDDSGPRGARQGDGPPPRGGRHDDGPPPRGGRRDDGPPPRGGRHDDGPPPRVGRQDDGLPPRGGRPDDVPPPRGGRKDDAVRSDYRGGGRGGRGGQGLPRGGRGGERMGGDRGSRDDHSRGGGGRRRGGRDDGRAWRENR
jgi:THO complex subunit 1